MGEGARFSMEYHGMRLEVRCLWFIFCFSPSLIYAFSFVSCLFIGFNIYTFLLLFRCVLKSSGVKQSPRTSVEWQMHGCMFAMSIPVFLAFDKLNEKYSLAPVAMPRITLAYAVNGTRLLKLGTSVGA